ncbi:Uncharacterized protein YebE, UPF0316 family [Proteiniborus ethanoligenes]|uniref:UPF0316 protein SAMN05660462_01816 n=1 Tax=Proteiniborus ethanoligenes TaxID=415015 RepID=A0A1H3Q603_9FIRM|nr:DUF5698 domain-containing protein [Proteiniborus ethanoligenes]SDZ08806.1 Uncharacterized protein YebE, UPF0316 family [Proteiniborus ethanoligenes]
MEAILGYLFIFGARIVDVSMSTIRMLMVVQGRRKQAAIIGFFEVIVYIVALNRVVNGLTNPGNLLAYALGYASGNFIGSYIEEKIALGNLTAQVILKDVANNSEKEISIIDELRANGFGVTVIVGQGKEGPKSILNIGLKRKDLDKLHKLLANLDKEAFITVSTTKLISGGYFPNIKRK